MNKYNITKICTKCGKRRKLSNFRKERNSCKECNRLDSQKWNREHKKQQHLWYLKNKQRLLKRRKEYYQETKEHTLAVNRKWSKNNKIKRKNYIRKWKKENLKNKLADCLRNRVRNALKNNRKIDSTKNLIGCSIEYLKQHLEKQFTKGMTWSNQGKWHIDHIKPCCSFDLSKNKEQHKCFHYSNLQPLWAKDNISKGNKERRPYAKSI